MDEKNELILWKLSCIQIKILDDIELSWGELNSYLIEFKYINWNLNWIELNFKFNYIQFINWIKIQFNSNLIWTKLDANWSKRYWTFVREYGVVKKKL